MTPSQHLFLSAPALRWSLVTLLLTGAMACKREAPPQDKAPQSAIPPALPAGHPTVDAAAAPNPAAANLPIAWTVPKGWTQTPGTGMRVATLKPPAAGNAEMTIVPLSGAAGGELANVNRWRGQLGLAAIDEKALGTLRQTVTNKLGKVSVFDFTSEGAPKSRMLVACLVLPGGDSWFFKMTGEAEPVGKAKPEFLAFLESLRKS